jgi:HD superfamily phosphodiesterase
MSDLLREVEGFVRSEYSKPGWQDFPYHNISHTESTVQEVAQLAKNSNVKKEKLENLLIAAWFHDLGYSLDNQNHESKSAQLAQEFLTKKQLDSSRIEIIQDLILSTSAHYSSFDSVSKEILHDADLSSAGMKGFAKRSNLLRQEWQDKFDKSYSDDEWNELQIDYLSSLGYKSIAGIEKYDKRRQKNLKKLMTSTSKSKDVTKKLGRGIETVYRVTYRNHINFSAIADNKANMLIGINAIILSIVLTVIGSGLVGSLEVLLENITLVVPVGILMLCSSIAMVFAVLSARPNIAKQHISFDPNNIKATNGILFFGNYSRISQSDFNLYMTALLENEPLTYENMNNDLYNLGQVLQKKYKLLRKAYNIFMFGLILSISCFFLILFFTLIFS